jgi:hypothetical protein
VPSTEAEILRVKNAVVSRIKSEIATVEKAAREKEEQEQRKKREQERIDAKRRSAEFTISLRLSYVRDYLRRIQEEDEFDFEDFFELANEIQAELRPVLLEELMQHGRGITKRCVNEERAV